MRTPGSDAVVSWINDITMASPLWAGEKRPVLGGGTEIGLWTAQYIFNQEHSDLRCTADLNTGVTLKGFSIIYRLILAKSHL